jgi:hypothetical protein
MSAVDDRLMGKTVVRRWLTWTWFGIFPLVVLIVGSFLVERACFDRYTLLPAIGTRPGAAYVVAAVYTLAHAWLVAAYAATVAHCRTVLPPLRCVRDLWHAEWFKALSMAAILALEYVPAGVWSHLAGTLGACPK